MILSGFNTIQVIHTASGRCCYFITFVFPSFQSGTRDVRTSSSLRSSAASHPSSHTASGRHCCNCLMIQNMGIRILAGFNTASGKPCCNVNSIYPHNSQVLWLSFNTASGKCCYFITFVFPSLRSGTRDVRPSSSLRSSAASHPSSHTASGRHCYFITFVFPSFQSGTRDVRSSSSLHSSAASHPSSHTASGKPCCNRCILTHFTLKKNCFNTASGRHFHSILFVFPSLRSGTRDVRSSSSLRSSAGTFRRILRAVGTVAMQFLLSLFLFLHCFNTASGRHCYFITFVFPSLRSGTRDVRPSSSLRSSAASHPSSHTASGKCYCNRKYMFRLNQSLYKFQYRKQ